MGGPWGARARGALRVLWTAMDRVQYEPGLDYTGTYIKYRYTC